MTDAAGTEILEQKNKSRLPAALLFALLVCILIYAFRDGLHWAATGDWLSDEYNHCYLIPFITLFLLATRARDLAAVAWEGSVAGLWILGLAFVMLVLGEFSAIYTISQLGFVVGVIGAAIAVFGLPFFRIAWPALVYLFFLVPLPDFLQVKLSADLQLISSILGVGFLRLFGLPVYLEGNVIDLGTFQLAVAEACSGLRYLFPLMSFGFLCAVLYQAPSWQRVVVFLSSIPITMLMNSLRIGMIGVLVNDFGIEQAQGFLHDFEGWAVFMVCVGILFLEMFMLARLSGRRLLKSLRMDTPPVRELLRILGAQPAHRLALAGGALVIAGGLLSAGLEKRQDLMPRRGNLTTFPLHIGDWRGTEEYLEPLLLEGVKADDTLLATYDRGSADPLPVGLWIAYYSSQRSGRAVHSPAVCLPGGGWEIQSFGEQQLEGITPDGQPLPVNRVIIGLGEHRQLVYYWFAQRGRNLTNEYLVKWYIFWDALTRNRTDGALVRLTTYIDGENGVAAADKRLQDFVRDVDPKLAYFIPQRDAELLQAKAD